MPLQQMLSLQLYKLDNFPTKVEVLQARIWLRWEHMVSTGKGNGHIWVVLSGI